MATNTTELVLKFTGDSRQLQQVVAAVRRDLSQLGQSQVATTTQTERQRIAETVRSANQRLREEQRAAREVNRIMAETARQAAAQEKVRERAAKNLADVQVREAKRAAKELERSIAAGRTGGAGSGGDLLGFASQAPLIGRFAAQFSALETSAVSAGGAIASVAAPIAAVTIAATAGIAALALLGKTIFELSKQTAEFEGKFFDLSQQVGVSVETLSTLDVIASTTGGNIETVTASLGIFQKNLEASHDPTSKEAKLLKELGVTSLDTEVALRQSLKGLFALGEGAKQTNDVLQLFGRSGRFVNAILKESKGDIDAARVALGGLVVARDAAAAADAFNDSLEIMNRNLFAIARQITGSAIPVFTVFFQQINQALTGNKNDWSSWSDVVQIEVAAALGAIQGFAQFVASGGNIPLGIAIDANIRTLIQEANRLKNQLRFESDAESIRQLTRSVLAGRPGDTPDPAKAGREAQSRAAKDIQLQQQRLEEATRVHRAALERERDLDLKSIDEWEQESFNIFGNHLAAQQKIFDQERALVRRFVKDREDQLLQLREIDQKDEKAQNEFFLGVQRVQDEARKRREQSILALERQFDSFQEVRRQGQLQRIKSAADKGLILQSHAIRQEIDLLKAAHDIRINLIDLEIRQSSTSAERKIELDNQKSESEQKYTDEFKRLTLERIRAIQEEAAEGTPRPGAGATIPDLPRNPVNLEDLGLPPPDGISVWQEALKTLREQMESFAGFVRGTFLGVFEGIADAVAQGVYAWALYGESFGKAMKQALAAVAAKIAAEAALQAVLHAAYAIASLAVMDFRGAAQHGLAAAKFAAVAALAGAGARAIAGNVNQGAGAGAGGSTGQQRGAAGELNPITLGRNQAEPRRIVIELRAAKDKISQAFTAVVLSDVNGAGPIRQAFADDGVF